MTAAFRFGTVGLLLFVSLAASSSGLRAEAGPFAILDGTWSGEGNITTSGGLRERLRCRATYKSAESGDHVRLALRCASDSYNFDLAGDVDHRNGAISGSWTEASRKASGTISGRAHGDQIEASAKGDTFSVNLSLTTRGNRQAVTIQSLAAEVTNVSITLNKWCGAAKTCNRRRVAAAASSGRRATRDQPPTASFTHFAVKLVWAAPASFLSAACLSQVALASVSHFVMKLVFAAPARFLFLASTEHDAACALLAANESRIAITAALMDASLLLAA